MERLHLSFPDQLPGVVWELIAPNEAAVQSQSPPEAWLAPAEQEAMAALRVEGRRQEWCAGRLAVKRAVQRWLRETRGVDAPLVALVVTQDEQGAPHVAVPAGCEPPAVSIAHSDGYGFAALVPPECEARVGVDIERLRDLRPRLLSYILAPGEEGSPTIQPPGVEPLDGVTLWTLKEATVKALGIGLRLPMSRLAVTVTAPGIASITRVPGPPHPDDHAARPWSATASFCRSDPFTFAIVTLTR